MYIHVYMYIHIYTYVRYYYLLLPIANFVLAYCLLFPPDFPFDNSFWDCLVPVDCLADLCLCSRIGKAVQTCVRNDLTICGASADCACALKSRYL